MSDRLLQLISLGREHYVAGEYDRAEPVLAEVISIRPAFADVFNMLGVIHHAKGRFAEAEKAFENALRINPNYTEAALNLSVTYNDLGKYDRGREIYSRVVESTSAAAQSLDPFARGKLANMHADLGDVYAGVRMYDEAIREYRHALALCPDFVDLRVRLGNVFRDMGNHRAAILELEAVKELKPDFLPARVSLGVVLFSLDRKADAMREWQDVLSRDPHHAAAARYLRMVEIGEGPRPGSAITDLTVDEG